MLSTIVTNYSNKKLTIFPRQWNNFEFFSTTWWTVEAEIFLRIFREQNNFFGSWIYQVLTGQEKLFSRFNLSLKRNYTWVVSYFLKNIYAYSHISVDCKRLIEFFTREIYSLFNYLVDVFKLRLNCQQVREGSVLIRINRL